MSGGRVMGRLEPGERPRFPTGGDRVQVIVNEADGPDVWVMDGRIGYVQRRYVDANRPVVEVLFPPTGVRKQVTLKLPLGAVKKL